MKSLIIALALLMFPAHLAWSQTKGEVAPLIVVTGSGSSPLTIDTLVLELMVQNTGRTAKAAAERNAEITEKVRHELSLLDVPPTAISTRQYKAQLVFDFNAGRPATPRSYEIRNQVRVETQAIELAGDIVDAALQAGATGVKSVRFSASQLDEARHSALVQATTSARTDAQAMAESVGGRLGDLVELTTQGTARPPEVGTMSAGVTVVERNVGTSLDPEPQYVNVTVLGRWRFVGDK